MVSSCGWGDQFFRLFLSIDDRVIIQSPTHLGLLEGKFRYHMIGTTIMHRIRMALLARTIEVWGLWGNPDLTEVFEIQVRKIIKLELRRRCLGHFHLRSFCLGVIRLWLSHLRFFIYVLIIRLFRILVRNRILLIDLWEFLKRSNFFHFLRLQVLIRHLNDKLLFLTFIFWFLCLVSDVFSFCDIYIKFLTHGLCSDSVYQVNPTSRIRCRLLRLMRLFLNRGLT
jgi:hypothetical protein